MWEKERMKKGEGGKGNIKVREEGRMSENEDGKEGWKVRDRRNRGIVREEKRRR